ncbi:MAG: uracil-DNA glycosylase [Chloroflexi bacterium]|nr:uracil-DNA glycosylase [Chloroflexota bacterium]
MKEELLQLAEQIRACTKCGLAKGRTQAVPGDTPAGAEIVFVGEGPGFHEDQQGRPFVGAAGQFLNELLGSVGLRRQEVAVLNVVKCRPPQNRDPLPDELAACDQWLARQLALLRPRLVVTLGRYSMAKYFPGETISRIHGKARRRDGVTYLPLYHPAAALHQPRHRADIEADFKQIPRLLAEARQQATPPAPPPEPVASQPAAQSPRPEPETKKDAAEPRQLPLF